nr:hypothetical protein [Tanacetum cinerariifolium]
VSSTTPPTPTPTTTVESAPRLSATAKGKQPSRATTPIEPTDEEESFDPIPRTPEESDEESNNEEDQDLRLSEEARIQEEEKADKLYRDININQGRGLQVTQNVEDTRVTLTPVNPDGPQESSSMSSFISTTGSQSRQMSASEYAFAEEPVQTNCQMEETPHPVYETGADDQP